MIRTKSTKLAASGTARLMFGPFQSDEIIFDVRLSIKDANSSSAIQVSAAMFVSRPEDLDSAFSAGQQLIDGPQSAAGSPSIECRFALYEPQQVILPLGLKCKRSRWLAVQVTLPNDGEFWASVSSSHTTEV